MAFVQTLGGTEQVMIAGSFSDDIATVRGTGFSVAVSSGVYTITLDRAYNGLISCTATVMNSGMSTGESLVALMVSHSITDGTTGGTIVLNTVDDTGAIEAGPTSGIEVHFTAILDVDT
tara:strand:+ start:1106 stop:1462 length:357 start_codon:yes stop_codon:yes gene_type:complete